MTIRMARCLVATAVLAAMAPIALLSVSPAAAQSAVTVRDEFRSISFAGNDGPLDFSGPWIERGESDGPAAGALRVAPSDRCVGGTGNCLHIGLEDGDLGAYAIDRRVDLQGATEATFTFRWRRDVQGQVGGAVRVRVSGNGGGSWTTLRTITLAGSQGASSESFDIAPWASDSTVIRFEGTGADVDGYLTVDDVQIAAVIAPTTTTVAPTTTTLPSATTTTLPSTTTTQPGATTTTTLPSTTTSLPGATSTTTLPGGTTTTIPGVTPTTTPGTSTSTTVPTATTSTTPPATDSTTPDEEASTSTIDERTTTSAPSVGEGIEPTAGSDELRPPTDGSDAQDGHDAGHGDTARALPASEATDPATTRPLLLVGAQFVILGALVVILAYVGMTAGRPPSD